MLEINYGKSVINNFEEKIMFTKFMKTTVFLALFLLVANAVFGQEVKQVKSKNLAEKVQKTETEELSKEDSKESVSSKNETLSVDSKKTKSDKPNAKKQTERRRIITAEEIKKRRSPVGSLLMKPFRSIAPVVTDRVTVFEEDKQYLLLFGAATLPISPAFGGVTENSGFGVGFTATSRDYISKDFRIVGSSLVTTEKYARTNFGFEITPQKFRKNDLTIKLIGEQLLLAEQDFYGRGVNSIQDDESEYYQRQLGAKLSFEFEPSKNFEFGAFSEFTRNDITGRNDEDSLSISDRFNSQVLRGFDRNVRLLETGAFIESKFLDEEENPHLGFSTKFSFSNVDSPGSKDFGWQNYGIDARTYIPLGNKLRVIALRFLGDFKETKGNSAIPFFRLAKLGTGETLRGYDTYRFQGKNSVHLNAEYRFKLMQGFETSGFTGVEGVFFGDFGQVYNRRSELSSKNLRATWGGGFRITTAESVVLTILYAQSPERGTVIWRFGRTF